MKNLVIYILSILMTVIVSLVGYCTYLVWLSTEGVNIEIKEGTVFMKDEK